MDTSDTKIEIDEQSDNVKEIDQTTTNNKTDDKTITTTKSNENMNKNENIDSNKLILERIEKLNVENHCLKQENAELNNRLNELDKSCLNFKTKADSSTKQADNMRTELQSMVIKYATSERDVIELRKRFTDVDKKYKELVKERDHFQAKTKDLMQDKKQLMTNLEKHVLDAAYLTNKNDILKNKLEQQELNIQRMQLSFDNISKRYEESKSTLQSIESAMEKLNLNSEGTDNGETGQNSSEDNEHDGNVEDKSNSESCTNESSSQTNKWINIYLNCVQSNNNLTAEVDHLKNEIEKYKIEISDLNIQLNNSNEQVKNSLKKLELIETLKNELINRQDVINDLKGKFDKINEINRDLLNDASSSKHKESELLEYTERLTAKLVSLQSEHNIINEKLKNLEEDCRKYSDEKNLVTIERDNLQNELNSLKTSKENEIKELNEKINDKNNELEYLKRKIEELENDINIMKRKHILNLKELNKEIQLLKKQPKQPTKSINIPQSPAQQTSENSSTLSSHNSLSSLNEINDQILNNGEKPCQNESIIDLNNYVNEESSVSESCTFVTNHQNALETENPPQLISSNELTSLNDIDKNRLIERILRLQRQAIKRNEKIDFLEEHNAQLVEEVQKKSKLLQYYILKEETGALATETMDKNKVKIINYCN